MTNLNIFLTIAYLIGFVAELIILDRFNKTFHVDSFLLTAILSLLFLCLLFVSLRNIKATAGKVGLLVLILSVLFRFGIDLFI